MTKTALQILSKGENGFVLFVEAAHIDKAHHKNMAKKAIAEVLELELAVETAAEEANLEETLIIVTADHSHSLTINGYPREISDLLSFDNKPGSQQQADTNREYFYSTLMYSTGPGGKTKSYLTKSYNLEMDKDNYQYPANVFKESASHQGKIFT